MAKQSINVGTSPNDNRGDSLRISFQKINANFTELYTALGLNADINLNLGAFEFTGSVMSTTDSSAIVIDQAVTVSSNLTVGGDIVPNIANGGNLGSLDRPFRSLYVSNNTVYLGGVPLSLDTNNNLTVNGSPVTGGGNSFDQDLNTDDSVTFNSVGATTINVSQINGTNPGDELVIQANNHNWTFGTDGSLTFPDGYLTIQDSQGGVVIQAADEKAISLYSSGDGDIGSAIGWFDDFFTPTKIAAVVANNPLYVGKGDVGIITGGAFGEGITNIWNFGADGNLIIPGDIRSEGNINIDINLSDSTLRRWQFGEDGALTLPGGKVQVQASSSSGSIRGSANTPIIVYSGGTTGQVSLQWTNANPENNVAATAFSGVIVNSSGDGAGDVGIITGAYNPMNGQFDKTWTFKANGSLTFPNATTQTTAWTGSVSSLVNGSHTVSLGTNGNLTAPGRINLGTTDNIGYEAFTNSNLIPYLGSKRKLQGLLKQEYANNNFTNLISTSIVDGIFSINEPGNTTTKSVRYTGYIKNPGLASQGFSFIIENPTPGDDDVSITISSNAWPTDNGGVVVGPYSLFQMTTWGDISGDTVIGAVTQNWDYPAPDLLIEMVKVTIELKNIPALGQFNISWSSESGASGDDFSGLAFTDVPDESIASDADIRILSAANTWKFGEDGNLTLPSGGDILDSNGDSVLGGGSTIYTPDNPDHWNSPTVNTISAALDELAGRLTAFENFEIDGGNANTPAAGELLIDGNGA